MAPASRTWFPVAAMALTLVIALPPALAGDPRAETVQFSLADLGTLGGVESHAYLINKQGQVAGISQTQNGETHAFLWEDGTMRDLGSLEGNQSAVVGLNDWGQVVGWSAGPEGTHAFLWEDGVMSDLGTLGGFSSYALLINDAGQVAGHGDTTDGEEHAFLWADGRMVDLTAGTDDAPCYCYASLLGLNARGQVIGIEFKFVPGPYIVDAILWENGARTVIAAGDESSYYRVERINDRGEISGTHVFRNGFDVKNPFLWRNGSIQEWNLGGASSKSMAMNKYGQVVGEGRTAVGELHGFSWSAGKLTDLGRPSTWAADVNDRGLVVGSAYFQNRGTHAALWTPIGRVAPRVVPELTDSAQ